MNLFEWILLIPKIISLPQQIVLLYFETRELFIFKNESKKLPSKEQRQSSKNEYYISSELKDFKLKSLHILLAHKYHAEDICINSRVSSAVNTLGLAQVPISLSWRMLCIRGLALSFSNSHQGHFQASFILSAKWQKAKGWWRDWNMQPARATYFYSGELLDQTWAE